MTLSSLLQQPGILDIRSTQDTVYILTTTNSTYQIFTDKQLEYVPVGKLLNHEKLTEILAAESLAKNRVLQRYIQYTYDLSALSKSKKQSFAHKLHGTGGRTRFLDEVNGTKLGRSTVQVLGSKQKEMEDFLKEHNVPFTTQEILMENIQQ